MVTLKERFMEQAKLARVIADAIPDIPSLSSTKNLWYSVVNAIEDGNIFLTGYWLGKINSDESFSFAFDFAKVTQCKVKL